MGSWTSQRTREEEATENSRENFAFSTEMSHQTFCNVEKRDDRRYSYLFCYEDYWRFSSVKAFPWTNVWNETKPRNGSCKQSVWLLCLLSSAASSVGATLIFLPLTHCVTNTNKHMTKKQIPLISWRIFVWFYYKHKHCICDFFYSTILTKLKYCSSPLEWPEVKLLESFVSFLLCL